MLGGTVKQTFLAWCASRAARAHVPSSARRVKGLICEIWPGAKRAKTYNSRCSLVVTYLTTDPPVCCLNRAERTGNLAVIWPLTTNIPNSTVSSVATAENRPQKTPICKTLHALVARNMSDLTATSSVWLFIVIIDPDLRLSRAAGSICKERRGRKDKGPSNTVYLEHCPL